MAEFKNARQLLADILAKIIHLGNQTHIRIHKTLNRLDEENLTIWKKMGLSLIKLYARVLPKNGKNNGIQKD